MPSPAIVADGLTKVYRSYPRPADRLWEALLRRPRHSELRALDDVSFVLPKGEGLGVIGENGAGKSTLLKILCGVTRASAGTLSVDGRVAAILELGAGFHPEFTGRQNAVLNAALLGLSEGEVDAALPRIVDFSELGDFIDRPVKTYSTGMAMRLAFSIATHVEPEVLIVDEALSVGDGYFQKKCMDRMLAFIRGGGTVLFCSHAMYYVSSLCRHALWLRAGRVERFGPALDVVHAYEEHLASRRAAVEPAAAAQPPTDEERRPARLLALRWLDDGSLLQAGMRTFGHGEPWGLEVEWQTDDAARAFHLAIGLDRADGVQVCSFATHQDGLPPVRGGGRQRLRLRVPSLPIVNGELALYVFLLDEEGLHVYDQQVIHAAFRVESPGYRTGVVTVEHDWEPPPAPQRSAGLTEVSRQPIIAATMASARQESGG
ncbi:MAG TPA: ABC transporter ATP-binding protein [Thermoanaerobaculia bacterium]|jgi:ABC-type polysaccharide/polyol phosphate transport system ATPase subunit|nr:ABC transporter ATP-binding protein [Thermoanaerobaculia bacterium]